MHLYFCKLKENTKKKNIPDIMLLWVKKVTKVIKLNPSHSLLCKIKKNYMRSCILHYLSLLKICGDFLLIWTMKILSFCFFIQPPLLLFPFIFLFNFILFYQFNSLTFLIVVGVVFWSIKLTGSCQGNFHVV